ncbi:hypothetical protein [Cellulomonas endophytica]|uniref:hypothetical protein n=1 Tax=Cellulomonas endophytica TaxID=2494735 RepID=UPI0013E90B8A|nr:hypothetical protein [Cellulomonas endophytica]
MRPAASWAPLALEDPVPGRPAEVAEGARAVAAAADALLEVVGALRTVAATGRARSLEALDARTLALATALEGVGGRARAAGQALVTYAEGLSAAQDAAATLLEDARAAAHALDGASDDASFWWARAAAAADGGDPAALAHEERATAAGFEAAAAEDRLVAARAGLRAVTARRDAAAEAALAVLDPGADGRGAVLGAVVLGAAAASLAWAHLAPLLAAGLDALGAAVAPVVDAVAEALSWLWEHLEQIADVVGFLALLLAWVPSIGPALGALATVLAVVVLVKHLVQVARGEQGAGILASDVLGVVTFGTARAAGAVVRVSAGTGGLRGGGAAVRAALSPAGLVREWRADTAAGLRALVDPQTLPRAGAALAEAGRSPLSFAARVLGATPDEVQHLRALGAVARDPAGAAAAAGELLTPSRALAAGASTVWTGAQVTEAVQTVRAVAGLAAPDPAPTAPAGAPPLAPPPTPGVPHPLAPVNPLLPAGAGGAGR